MGKCLPCSGVKSDQKSMIRRLKKEYEEGKSESYLFRTEENGNLKVVSKSSFNVVFESKIKPNFDKGAEYFHISEFTFK